MILSSMTVAVLAGRGTGDREFCRDRQAQRNPGPLPKSSPSSRSAPDFVAWHHLPFMIFEPRHNFLILMFVLPDCSCLLLLFTILAERHKEQRY